MRIRIAPGDWAARGWAVIVLGTILVAATAGPVAAAKPTTGWASAVKISPTLQPDPRGGSQLGDVAVNASGLTVAAWEQYTFGTTFGSTIGFNVQSGGRWGTPSTMSSPLSVGLSPRVAAGSDGTLVVSWIDQDPAQSGTYRQRAMVAVRPGGSTTWTTTVLDDQPIGGVAITGFVPVAVDGSGNVTAIWSLWDGARHVVKTATRSAAGGMWSGATSLSGTSDGLYISLAVDVAGDAVVAWTQSPYASAAGTWAEVVTRTGPAGGWTAPVKVSETVPNTVGYVVSPIIAMDRTGQWTLLYFANGLEVVRQTASGWSTPVTVIAASVAGSSYVGMDLAVDDAGNAIVVTSIFDPTVGVDRASVWVTRGSPGTAWTPPVRLTNPTLNDDAYAPRAGLSPDGTLAMVAWVDYYHGVVLSSSWTGTAWGAPASIGRGTALGSFRQVLGLDVATSSVARAMWKSTPKSGTEFDASNYRP
jgi:hypothetical protein